MMNEMEIKYFAVEAKCGHVGRKNCIIITFPIVADDKKDAARIARKMPRVKHDHKDAILSVKQISEDEYLSLKEINSSDDYLRCESKQDQRMLCKNLDSRVIKDTYFEEVEYKTNRQDRINYKRKKYLSFLVGDRYCLNSSFI
ncbi:hypothetical protein EI71_00735 [Anaeroplasma bactoclasticum]|jgi:hypothetical protein|uniref:Uncharacterized protein n=1 Tax=Anaeroplasma bactoclasticum TaxID=2088 RepID=A0A397RXG2_9MOLU|nr:hypothetical protein [Anaeroplasma bactoclasticum]RIA77952.1 hypothetical protein EI71_00735 [Anaeroplasma bactoclasticum]